MLQVGTRKRKSHHGADRLNQLRLNYRELVLGFAFLTHLQWYFDSKDFDHYALLTFSQYSIVPFLYNMRKISIWTLTVFGIVDTCFLLVNLLEWRKLIDSPSKNYKQGPGCDLDRIEYFTGRIAQLLVIDASLGVGGGKTIQEVEKAQDHEQQVEQNVELHRNNVTFMPFKLSVDVIIRLRSMICSKHSKDGTLIT